MTTRRSAVPSSGARAISVKGLTKRYGRSYAVDAVDLEISAGEFFTLLGPSGSGKTSILMMIAGFVEPDDGAILLDGADLTRMSVERRNIGVVFQNYALFPHMTVAQNLAFPLETRRIAKPIIAQKIDWVLGLVGLATHRDKYPSQISGGQQQRIAVARALVFEPSILLMDEPLGALDKNLRARLQLELRSLQRSLNITTIYVTHDQEEAFAMSDRIAVMRDGQVEQIAEPADLYLNPKSIYVAEFVGDSNTIAGVLSRSGPHPIVRVPVLGDVQTAATTIKNGADVNLTFRPERVSISRLAARPPMWGRNVFEGVVAETIFAGPHTKYLVKVVDQCVVQVRTSSTRSRRLFTGDDVAVCFEPDDVLVLPIDKEKS